MGVDIETESSEIELIRRVAKGERDQFHVLVLTYQDRIFSLVMRQVGDRTVAEELTQDTFLRAYRSLPSFRFESKFSTWLTRIALNVTQSYFVSKRYKESKRRADADLSRFASANPAEGLETEESIRHLQECIGELSPTHREIIVLCCLEQKSYEEAAEILGIPRGTVGSRLHKAFKSLRGKFWNG